MVSIANYAIRLAHMQGIWRLMTNPTSKPCATAGLEKRQRFRTSPLGDLRNSVNRVLEPTPFII